MHIYRCKAKHALLQRDEFLGCWERTVSCKRWIRSQGDLLMQMLNRNVRVWPKAAATGKHVSASPHNACLLAWSRAALLEEFLLRAIWNTSLLFNAKIAVCHCCFCGLSHSALIWLDPAHWFSSTTMTAVCITYIKASFFFLICPGLQRSPPAALMFIASEEVIFLLLLHSLKMNRCCFFTPVLVFPREGDLRCHELKTNQLTVLQPRWRILKVVKKIQHCVCKWKTGNSSQIPCKYWLRALLIFCCWSAWKKKNPIERFIWDHLKLTLAAVAQEEKY